jgi:Tfp pilus assembly protein PilP
MTAGAAFAQNPDAIDNARSVAKSLQQKQANDTNAALDAAGTPATSKPAPGSPAPAVKPAAIPGAKPVAVAAVPTAKPAKTSSDNNKLQRVNLVPSGDSVQVEITSSQAAKPNVYKMSSPARVVVELPETIVATSQSKIPGSGGVKGVRIGMDGKTPPTTSVVVDLDKAVPYEMTPAGDGKFVLILHTQGAAPAVAKATPAPVVAKASPKASPAPSPVVAKASPAPSAKTSQPAAQPKAAAQPASTAKPTVAKAETPKPTAPAAKAAAKSMPAKTIVAAKSVPAPAAATPVPVAPPKPQEKKWAMSGKRDPFFSPVVQQTGSGCSTGKKCLEIGNINLRGVVKSDTGFIAVVTNNLNKAYFLRENDPVFNGYVVKITGDSVTFSETVQDKLGKPFTREVVKRIFTPAV